MNVPLSELVQSEHPEIQHFFAGPRGDCAGLLFKDRMRSMKKLLIIRLSAFFVVLLGAAMIAIVIGLVSGKSHRGYNVYQIDLRDSVAGISVNSPVKYNGV